MVKRVVILADLHGGSRYGLCPPVVKLVDGGEYRANRAQAGLWEAWRAAANGYWGKPDFLVINGDAIDGLNKKRAGVEQWTTDLYSQVAIIRDAVKLWRAKCVYIVRGTPYHVQIDGQPVEEVLARELDAHPFPPEFNPEKRSGGSLYLTVEGVTFHFAHRCGGLSSVWQYRATPITREMLLAKLNAEISSEMAKYDVNVVVRAHQHFFWRSESTSHVGLMIPAWQVKTPYADERNSLGFIPDIGFVGVDIQGKNYAISKIITKLRDVVQAPHAIHAEGAARATNSSRD